MRYAQNLADLLWGQVVGQDEGTALPVDLCDSRSAFLVVAPWAREAKQVHVKGKRGIDVLDVEDGAREPVSHRSRILEFSVSQKTLSETWLIGVLSAAGRHYSGSKDR
jgi:hypothetical protein